MTEYQKQLNILALELIAAKAAMAALGLKENKLYPGDLSDVKQEIAKTLQDIKEQR